MPRSARTHFQARTTSSRAGPGEAVVYPAVTVFVLSIARFGLGQDGSRAGAPLTSVAGLGSSFAGSHTRVASAGLPLTPGVSVVTRSCQRLINVAVAVVVFSVTDLGLGQNVAHANAPLAADACLLSCAARTVALERAILLLGAANFAAEAILLLTRLADTGRIVVDFPITVVVEAITQFLLRLGRRTQRPLSFEADFGARAAVGFAGLD